MPGYTHISESELLQYLRASDADAFTEIYNRYWQRLVSLGYYYTKDQQAAEDVVHDVMMSLWMRRDDVVIQSLPAYLAKAVKFAVFKSILRQRKRKHMLAENFISEMDQSDLEAKLDARFMEEFLRGVIDAFPEKTRLVFTYSRQDALSVSEIAGKMDLSPKAVEYHITKAIRALRNALQKIKIFFI